MTKKFVLIIALSVRPFIQSAKEAGYSITTIDGFADQETVALANKTFVVNFDVNGFEASQLLATVKSLTLSDYIGFVYGSGFDAQPALLQQLSALLPCIGNNPECVEAIKTTASFFDILNTLNIRYPTTFFSTPMNATTQPYLVKYAGGSGGSHIQIFDSNALNKVSKNYYFQQYIEGRSISLLFLATQNVLSIIGFNEQLISYSAVEPFRYGGAVSNIDLMLKIKKQLIDYAEKITMQFGLVGLNSLDVILQNDDVYVLEINPRLSATFDLYYKTYKKNRLGLFEAHVQSCYSQSAKIHLNQTSQLSKVQLSKAHVILYSPQAIKISSTFSWPVWVSDIPTSGQATINIELDAPICTVFASANNAESAKQLAQSRVKMLLEMLINHSLQHH